MITKPTRDLHRDCELIKTGQLTDIIHQMDEGTL